eukprot:6179724-Pleurochrysis_carterae.AAC.1
MEKWYGNPYIRFTSSKKQKQFRKTFCLALDTVPKVTVRSDPSPAIWPRASDAPSAISSPEELTVLCMVERGATLCAK